MLLAAGCHSDSDPLAWRMTSGFTVEDLVTQTPAVVLVLNPSDCFTCYGPLASWEELAHRPRNPVPVFLVLTAPATPAEQEQFMRIRVKIAGVLANPSKVRRVVALPAEILVTAGAIIGIHPISRNQITTPLMRHFTGERVGKPSSGPAALGPS
jgi:hypothetical protein